MGDVATDVNKTAKDVNTGIDIAGGTIVTIVENMIIADAPFLAFPVFKQFWELLFSWIVGYFIKAAKQGATFTIIDLQVNSEVSKMTKALIAVQEAQKTGNPDEIKKAIEDYAKAQSALTHFDGSASVD